MKFKYKILDTKIMQDQHTDVVTPKTKRGPGPRGLKIKARKEKEVAKPNDRLTFKELLFELNNLKKHQYSPKVDLKESGDKFTVRVELPGVLVNDIKVYIRDSVFLIISGNKYASNTNEQTEVYSECNYGYFTRRVKVSCPVSAKFDNYTENGVLYITLYKNKSEITTTTKTQSEHCYLKKNCESINLTKALDYRLDEEKPQVEAKLDEIKKDFGETFTGSWADDI